jgi:hypothetical protein
MTDQERLSVWYEVSDDDTPTDDDNASQIGEEHDQLLPAAGMLLPFIITMLISQC